MVDSNFYRYVIGLLICLWVCLLVSLESPIDSKVPIYQEHLSWNLLNGSWEEESIVFWTLQEYEQRLIKYKEPDFNRMQLLPKLLQRKTESSFYITQDWEFISIKGELQSPNSETIRMINNTFSGDFLEDDGYYYFYNQSSDATPRIAIQKQDLPHFQFIGVLGDQDIESIIGYSNGYLVIPPYKFPVDQESFSFTPQDSPSFSGYDEVYSKTTGWKFFINNGKQYAHYLWSDKDWVYRWSESMDTDAYFIIREKKKSDFRILLIQEIQECFNNSSLAWIQFHPRNQKKQWKLLLESVGELPELYYSKNRIYVFWRYWNWSFPIDWSSLKWEEKMLSNGQYYNILSDKRGYYQFIYHTEWNYYELQKIRR